MNKMKIYTIDNYDFNNDDEFQKFFKSNLPNEYISPNKFMNKLNYCKREWIKILNSPPLRHAYNVPMDWGIEK